MWLNLDAFGDAVSFIVDIPKHLQKSNEQTRHNWSCKVQILTIGQEWYSVLDSHRFFRAVFDIKIQKLDFYICIVYGAYVGDTSQHIALTPFVNHTRY